ncbi:MAG: ABC transporter ATP-binding protein, partial [Alphaproteobacteria bacterium]|nr:ABC transporter ATP-binding protein [Alphaproteobacteria bacterium]
MKLFKHIPPMRKIPSHPFLFIWEALYGARKWALAGVILAFGLQLMKVFIPVYFSKMIEYFAKITPKEFSWAQMMWFLTLIFASYIGQSLFRMVRELIEENYVCNFMEAKIKLFGVDYLAKHSENYFSAQKSGQLSQKVIRCADAAINTHGIISLLYSNIFLILTNFFYIARVSVWFLLIVIIFGTITAYISYKVSFKMRALHEKSDNMWDNFQGIVADSISNSLNIKASGNEDFEISFVRKFFNEVKNSRLIALDKFQNITRLQQTLVCIFNVSMGLLLVKLWYQTKISIGDVTLVLLLMNTIIDNFTDILRYIPAINSGVGFLQATMSPFVIKHEIIDAPNAKKLKITDGAIEFKNVQFSYDRKKVFNKLSLKIKPKEKIGIVGVSGSGKSTLINLLQRAYDIEKGEILIDGQNIATVKQDSLHDAISIIPQDTSLFHRTISQNIAYGNLHAKQSSIENAAKKAYADEFI